MIIPKEKDPIGTALLDFVNGTWDGEEIKVDTSFTEDEELPVPYFFRTFEEMPIQEQKAMELAKGKVLDAGAGAGCHALELQMRGLDVTAIDISEASIEVMKKRGINNVFAKDLLEVEEQYDTVLMLMNGAGVFQTIDGMHDFFEHKLKKVLKKGGQLLIDSSDLIYLYEEGDGSFAINLNDQYHGEIEYFVAYKNIVGEPFLWLYVSYDVLEMAAEEYGFKCEKIVDGPHYDFLAKISY